MLTSLDRQLSDEPDLPVAADALATIVPLPLVEGRRVRGAVDRSLAFVLLALTAPLILLLMAMVRLTSRGPALYRQTRVGQGGREFTLWKLRTMTADAEVVLGLVQGMNDSDGLLFKIRRDPRTTALGRWLRRFSLDELPQLWNVVRGDMSLVGPRPPLPSEVARYDARTTRRLAVKPGLTGLWQVSGRSELSWHESIRIDLHYIEHWSPMLDLSILLRTVTAVLGGRGAW